MIARLSRRVLADVGLTLLVVGAIFAPHEFGGLLEPSVASILLLALGVAAMLLRRLAPRTFVTLTVALTLGAMLAGGALAGQLIAVLACVFAVGVVGGRRTTFVAAAAAALTIWLGSLIILGPVTTDLRAALLIFATIGFAAASGDSSRSRRAYIDEITDRALRAEEGKEAEARKRVAEERIAIARDLHDLVAHQIAVVSLNAGVASRALRDRPDDAERAIATIRDAAHTVLREISDLLTVLRTAETHDSAPRFTPQLGLAQLPDLLAELASIGLVVRLRQRGAARPLPEAVDVVAYRALQEAMTNALKHGGGDATNPATADVEISYEARDLKLTVTNRVTGALTAQGPPGHGLDGIRERVAAVRGRMTSEGGDVFRFTVWLPLAESVPT